MSTKIKIGYGLLGVGVFAIAVVIGYIPLDEVIEKGRHRRSQLQQEFPLVW